MLELDVNLSNSQDAFCENIFIPLVEILRKELAVFQELKDSIIYEKTILIKPSLDALNQNNVFKENIILKARMLGEARTTILKKIARNLNLDQKGIKLTQLAGYAGAEQKQEIEDILDDLALISQEINALNTANKDLLDASLKCVKSSIDFIGSMLSRGSIYTKSGEFKIVQNNGNFLHTKG